MRMGGGRQVASVSSPFPFFRSPPAHLLLKSFCMYLLNWPKVVSQPIALGPRGCCSCSSSAGGPTGSSCRTTRHNKVNAHAQRRTGVWRGRSRHCRRRSREAQPTGTWRGEAGAQGLSAIGTCLPLDVHRHTRTVRDIQVPRPNGAHVDLHSDAHRAQGRRGWTRGSP